MKMWRNVAWLCLLLFTPQAMASFDEAMAMYRGKDYAAAFAEFQRLAEIGDHASQFNVGVMYYRGESVGRDPIRAYAWMALANQVEGPGWAKMRDQVFTGLSEAQKVDAEAARKELFTRLSDEALASQLAPVLGTGAANYTPARVKKSVRPNYPSLARREEEMGQAEIIYAVGADGTTRLHGFVKTTTERDFAAAAVDALKRWQYEPARLNGKPIEQYGLRMRFVFKMADVDLNEKEMLHRIDELHDKADKGGADDAYHYASALQIFANFVTIPDDAGNPNQWYWKAAARGNIAAQFSLGNNLLYGSACTPDSVKGLAWLKRAAEAGQAEAQYVLAIEMLSGAHLAPDRPAAMKWLQRAASGSFAAAKLKLAWLYATSPDADPRDLKAAQSYLKEIDRHFVDRLSLMEVQAAVAAATGDFATAVHLQQKAIDEAVRYGLPTDVLQTRLKAYLNSKAWVETT